MRQGRDPLRRCICDTSANMQRKRTTHVSRSTEDRSKTLTAHLDLFGPVDIEGRGGLLYGFVAAVETHIDNGEGHMCRRGPDFAWTRATRPTA